MGLNSWEKICEALGKEASIERVLALKKEEIIAIPGFAERSAEQMVSGLIRSRSMIDDLLSAGVSITRSRRFSSISLLAVRFLSLLEP